MHRPLNPLLAAPERSAPLSRRRHGSVLILIVVMIAVLTLMGSAYLLVVRSDRQAARSTLEANRLEMVLNATIDLIRQELLKDLVNPEGQFSGIEPYDYPWTNPDVTQQVRLSDGSTANAAGGQNDDRWLASTVPSFDDAQQQIFWPHITNLTGIFLRLPAKDSSESAPKEYVVTNMGGELENYDTNLPVVGNNPTLDDADATWQPWGADADGDGVRDSRWTWAPVRQIGDIQYVMAVRIIDNSSLLNINIACPLTSDGNEGFASVLDPDSASHNPCGYWPSDLDLSRLLARSATYWQQPPSAPVDSTNARPIYSAVAEPSYAHFQPNIFTWEQHFVGLEDNGISPLGLLGFRGVTGTVHAIIATYETRKETWSQKSRFSLADEVELRWRNGLNRLPDNPTELEKALPVLLRSWGIASWPGSDPITINETGFLSVSNLPWPPPPPPAQLYDQMRAWFHGRQLGTSGQKINNRLFPDLRKFLTTWSGATAHAPDWEQSSNPGEPYKKIPLGEDSDPTLEEIAKIAFNIFNLRDSNNRGYLGYPTNSNELRKLAPQFALNLKDYIDEDNIPTSTRKDNVTYVGLEPLPFLREVYIQIGYEDKDLKDAENRTREDPEYAGPDGIVDTWEANLDSAAIAIEIGNPFDQRITFSDPDHDPTVRICVEDAAGNPARYFHISQYINITLEPRTDTSTADTLWFYANPREPLTENDTERDNLRSDIGLPTTNCFNLTEDPEFGQPTAADPLDLTSQITVSLQMWVNDDSSEGGQWITYDRLTSIHFQFAKQIPHNPWLEEPKLRDIHGQMSLRRDGKGSAFITNAVSVFQRPIGWDTDPHNTADPQPGDLYSSDAYDAMGSDDKGVTSPLPPAFQLNIANRGLRSLAELGWLCMVGFNDGSDGDLPTVLSGPDGTDGLLAKTQRADGSTWSGGVLQSPYLFLDFDANALIVASTGLPHAAMLLDQFTTLTPPGGGSVPFIPGQININTAPLHIATLAAPLPEPIDEIQNLMAAIAAYRDRPKIYATDTYATRREQLTGLPYDQACRLRTTPGIASLGELMFINPTDGAHPIPNAADTSQGFYPTYKMQRYGNDGTDQNNSRVDIYPSPEDIGATRASSLDNAEERMARFQFLSQVFTTRSDIFTAYILIRGYKAGQFNKDPVESARYIVIFDRSGVTEPEDSVKVLGVYRVQ